VRYINTLTFTFTFTLYHFPHKAT